MRLIVLDSTMNILIDFIAWLMIHVSIALICSLMPAKVFESDHFLFRTQGWERDGQFWQDFFKVRSWKEKLPDGATIIGRGYVKKNLKSTSSAELQKFMLESRRAELSHLLAIPPAVLFFLWNPPAVGWIMILYALIVNVPCLIAQRYNRPRIQRILSMKSQKLHQMNLQGGDHHG